MSIGVKYPKIMFVTQLPHVAMETAFDFTCIGKISDG